MCVFCSAPRKLSEKFLSRRSSSGWSRCIEGRLNGLPSPAWGLGIENLHDVGFEMLFVLSSSDLAVSFQVVSFCSPSLFLPPSFGRTVNPSKVAHKP